MKSGIKALAKLGVVLLPVAYFHENTYVKCLAVKRSVIAFSFEALIYLNYKYVREKKFNFNNLVRI